MTYCNYEKAREWLQNNLSDYKNFSHPNEFTNSLLHCIGSAIQNSTVVSKSKKPLRFELKPWINKNTKVLILLKEKLLRKISLKSLSKIIKFVIRKCNDNFYTESLMKTGNDPKKNILALY